jgi:uncharacterized protein
MAVIVKYIVVRNGEEKMTFATKKEADAYDKMLDIADNLFEFLEKSKINIDETQLEEIALLLAENRMQLISVLRGMKPQRKTRTKPAAKTMAEPAAKKSLPKKTKLTKSRTKK